MSAFNTSRPISADEQLRKLVEQKKNRKIMLNAALENYNSSIEAHKQEIILEKEDAKLSAESELTESASALVNRQKNITKNKKMAMLESRLMKEGLSTTMDAVMFDYILESSWIDAPKTKSEYQSMFESYKEMEEIIESVAEKNKPSKLMVAVENLVRDVVTKRIKHIVTEATEKKDMLEPEDIDSISFELTDSDRMELDHDLTDLGKDQIVDLVKSKVLSVVQDEKDASDKKMELIAELDQAEKNLEDKTSELNNSEEGDEPDDTTETSETATKESCIEAMILRNKKMKLSKASGATLFDALFMNNVNSLNNYVVTEGISVESKPLMDAAYKTTVFQYAVVETLNTLGIYNLNNITVAKSLRDKFKSMVK